MKRKTITLLALVFILSAISHSAFAQKKIKLIYKLKPGTEYSYNTDMDQDISFEYNGQTMTMNQKMTMNLTTRVEEGKEPHTYKLVSTIDRVTMNQSIFGMEINYDSGDSTTYSSGMGQKVGEAMNKIIGKSFSSTIDQYGKMIDMDMSLISEDNDLSETLNNSNKFAVFPEHKVAVGDSWEIDATPLKESSMKIHTKYTLLKIKGKKAIIGFESTISSDENSSQNINGTQKGESTINRKTGWAIRSTIDQDMKLKMEQNGMELPAEISSTIEITSRKK